GGFVALKLATLYPERVKSLSVLGAGWEEPKENSFFKRALKNSVEKLESNSGIDPISTFIEHDRKTGLLHKMWVKTLTKNFNDHKALSALLRNLLELQVDKEDLEKISFPVCIIVGERDPLRKSAEKLHNALLNSKLTVIPSKNHLTTLFSSEFHSTLRNFLLTYSN
ncbi:MAG: alpha/beta hydrolase, partial [Candidatus Hydrogenedentes bacterium]|nr:alpha/beta hydrolase [Candidatus Hydrogenedentota bacterium]